jgi:hypothetical protein
VRESKKIESLILSPTLQKREISTTIGGIKIPNSILVQATKVIE